jgi:hypothetical protein
MQLLASIRQKITLLLQLFRNVPARMPFFPSSRDPDGRSGGSTFTRYSVCVIDNDIPAAGTQAQGHGIKDTELLNGSNLQLLLDKETWPDGVIKSLIETLLSDRQVDGVSPKWQVFGVTNPSLYVNNINDGCFRADVIVFDWDYPTAQGGMDSESILKEILERSFCLVFIFSGADKKEEIEAILAKPEFQEFKGRLHYLDKSVDGAGQAGILVQRVEEMNTGNFSFKFANILRKKSVQSMDGILCDMGKASLNDIKNHVAIGDSGKKDFVDFMAERFRATIAGRDIYDLVDQIPAPAGGAAAPDEAMASKVWSNRLYFHRENGDDLIRRGDVVKVGTEYYLILSADCDLGRFWKKNLGIVNGVVLHPLENSNAELRKWLTLCTKPKDLADGNFQHLLDNVGKSSEGPFVLPFVPVGNGQMNFIALPKDILSNRVGLPAAFSTLNEKARSQQAIRYPHWTGAERICTISEPFLTPVIQHVLNALGGYGVPDYPDHMATILKKVLTDFNAAGAAAAGNPIQEAR